MPNQELIKYIKQNISAGVKDGEIREALRASGWRENDINEAFASVKFSQPEGLGEQSPDDGPVGRVDFSEDGSGDGGDLKSVEAKSDLVSRKKSGKGSKVVVFSVLVVVGVLLFAGLAAGYFGGYFNDFLERGITAEEILLETAKNQMDVYSGSFELSSSASLVDSESAELLGVGGSVFKVEGGFEADPEGLAVEKSFYVFSVEVEDPDSGEVADFGFEVRSLDEDVYFRITHLPDVAPGFMSDILSGQWVKVTMEDVEGEAESWGVEFESSVNVEDLVKDEELRKKISDIFSEHRIFNNIETLKGGEFEKRDVHKVGYSINVSGLLSAVFDISDFIAEEFSEEINEGFDLDEEEIAEMRSVIKESAESLFVSMDGEVWVDKDRLLLRRWIGEYVLDPADLLSISPIEILKESRDSTRLSDLASINSAMGLYLVDVSSPDFGVEPNVVYVSLPDDSPECANHNLPDLPSGWKYRCAPEERLANSDGTGWFPVDFTVMSTGSPLSRIPTDPINNAEKDLFYAFVADSDNLTFEINSRMESEVLGSRGLGGGSRDDGGTTPYAYEVGTDLTLVPDEVFSEDFEDGVVESVSFETAVSTDLIFRNHNEPITVEAPEDYMTLDEFLGIVLGLMFVPPEASPDVFMEGDFEGFNFQETIEIDDGFHYDGSEEYGDVLRGGGNVMSAVLPWINRLFSR